MFHFSKNRDRMAIAENRLGSEKRYLRPDRLDAPRSEAARVSNVLPGLTALPAPPDGPNDDNGLLEVTDDAGRCTTGCAGEGVGRESEGEGVGRTLGSGAAGAGVGRDGDGEGRPTAGGAAGVGAGRTVGLDGVDGVGRTLGRPPLGREGETLGRPPPIPDAGGRSPPPDGGGRVPGGLATTTGERPTDGLPPGGLKTGGRITVGRRSGCGRIGGRHGEPHPIFTLHPGRQTPM